MSEGLEHLRASMTALLVGALAAAACSTQAQSAPGTPQVPQPGLGSALHPPDRSGRPRPFARTCQRSLGRRVVPRRCSRPGGGRARKINGL